MKCTHCKNDIEFVSFPVKTRCGDWILGVDGVVALVDSDFKRIVNAELPEMETFVSLLMFDGIEFTAMRIPAFEPGCGWVWASASGWMIAGHPLLVAWRPNY